MCTSGATGRIRRNYRGWHLTADSKGVWSLIQLIDLMLKSSDETKETLKSNITTENELGVPNCKKKAISTAKIVLLNKKDNNEYWSISEAQGVVTFEAGDNALRRLKDGLTDVQNKKDDYLSGKKVMNYGFGDTSAANVRLDSDAPKGGAGACSV